MRIKHVLGLFACIALLTITAIGCRSWVKAHLSDEDVTTYNSGILLKAAQVSDVDVESVCAENSICYELVVAMHEYDNSVDMMDAANNLLAIFEKYDGNVDAALIEYNSKWTKEDANKILARSAELEMIRDSGL